MWSGLSIIKSENRLSSGEGLGSSSSSIAPALSISITIAKFCSSGGAGADAVDYKLISICHKGDIVVSQDYGVAAMALGKGAYAIHQSGKWYTDDNIDQMLMERHLSKKARRSSRKCHVKGPKKRTEEDDERFAQSFEKMLLMAREKEGR